MSRPKNQDFDWWAWKDAVFRADMGPSERLVVLRLERYANWTTGERAHPGVDLLAEDCKVGTATVKRALASMVKLGLAVQTASGRNGKQRNFASSYDLSIPDHGSSVILDDATDHGSNRTDHGSNERDYGSNGGRPWITGDPLPSFTPGGNFSFESTPVIEVMAPPAAPSPSERAAASAAHSDVSGSALRARIQDPAGAAPAGPLAFSAVPIPGWISAPVADLADELVALLVANGRRGGDYDRNLEWIINGLELFRDDEEDQIEWLTTKKNREPDIAKVA